MSIIVDHIFLCIKDAGQLNCFLKKKKELFLFFFELSYSLFVEISVYILMFLVKQALGF